MVIEILKRRLRQYMDAEAAILRGQEYRIGDRMMRRADLSAVRKAIEDLSGEIEMMEDSEGRRIKRVVFVE